MDLRVPPRIAAFFAFSAAGVWLALFGTGVALYPGYSVTDRWVSDLGNPAAPAPWTLNAGCILAGLLFVPFAWTLGQTLRGILGWAGAGILLVAEAFLVGVGLFPEESPNNMHWIVSVGFFFASTLAAVVLLWPLLKSSVFGRVSAALAGTVIVSSAALVGGTAIPEAVAVAKAAEHTTIFALLAWSLWNGARLWTSAGRSTTSA